MEFENEQWSRITRSKYRLLVQLFLTRTLVLLLSAFLFSNLVSLFTQLSFSTFLLPLFTQILDRKCMFLLCNAIMAFLGVKSRLYSASSFDKEAEADDMPHYIVNAEHDMLLQPLTVAEPVSQVESENKQNKLLKDEIVLASQYRLTEEDQGCEDVDIKDDEYGLTETPTNSEELKNRIEEFIRKMKEDIRL